MARTTVLHLAGSPTSDFFDDLSRLYAADCLRGTADAERYDVLVAHVSPGGAWRFPADLSQAALATAEPLPLARALDRVAVISPDVVVPQMFCLPGMTTYRALWDVLGVPYVGNTADVMALGAHKARAKAVVAAAGVRVPAGRVLRSGDPVPPIDGPVVVKPVDADNSVGLALVGDPAALDGAVREAFSHSAEVLVEQYVELGREVRCGVLEVAGELVCLPLEEYAVDRDTKPVRDRADKLSGSGDGLALVAKDVEHAWIVDPGDPITERVHAAARVAHRALGCRDYSLFDFRIDDRGEPWFLEAGLYCSFAEKSVVTVMARAAGTDLPTLFGTCVEQALTRTTP